MTANRSPHLTSLFVQLNFALCVGGAFFMGHMLIWSFVAMTILSIYALFKNGVPEITSSEKWLFALMIGYYLYFAWREVTSPYHLPSYDFLRENFPFLIAPLIILAFKALNIDKTFDWMANLCLVLITAVLLFSINERGSATIYRAAFTTDSPLTLSMFVISGVYISLAQFRERKGVLNLIWAGSIWLLGLVVIAYCSDSRTATFCYLVSAGIFVAYYFCSVNFSWRKNLTRLLVIGFFGILAIGLALYVIVDLNLMPRVAGLVKFALTGQKAVDDSTYQRTEMWRQFYIHWRDIPFFGVGPEDLFAYFRETFGYKTPFRHFHNDFINHFVAGGYIGAGLYFCLAFAPLLYLFSKAARHDRFIYVVFIVFASFVLSGLTNRIMFHPERVAWYVYLLIFIQIYFDQLRSKRHSAIGT